MYPEVVSDFGFVVTHEFLGKLYAIVADRLERINETAIKNAKCSHRLSLSIQRVCLHRKESRKPYQLKYVELFYKCSIDLKVGDNLFRTIGSSQGTLSDLVGPVNPEFEHVLRPTPGKVRTLEEVLQNFSLEIQDLYDALIFETLSKLA